VAVSDRFQQFESISVLVALEIVSSQLEVPELRHVEHDGDPFQVQRLYVAEELQPSATDDVSSWSAISYCTEQARAYYFININYM